MKFLLALLFLSFPLVTSAAAVPHWYQASGISYYFDDYYTVNPTNPWLYFVSPSARVVSSYSPNYVFGCDFTSACFYVPDDVIDGDLTANTDYYIAQRLATVDPGLYDDPADWFSAGGFISGGSNLVAQQTVYSSDSFCNYGSSTCPATVYVATYLKPKATDTDPDTYIPMSYWKLTLQSGSFGSDPIYTIESQSQANIFPQFLGAGSPDAIAFNLKEAIHANTIDPDCDFSELFESGFWSECVARSIFNWLLIPSDSAIDTLVAVSADPDFGTTWSYVVLAPIFTSTLVQACPMENPSTCDIGADYLTIPILDVNGDVTPFEVVPDSFVPAYFDAFLASIMQVLIIVSLSYILIFKFL